MFCVTIREGTAQLAVDAVEQSGKEANDEGALKGAQNEVERGGGK